MSTLLVPVAKITKITPIKGADKIELLTVNGWETSAPKGQYAVGQLVVYFPPDVCLTRERADEFGVTKYLGRTGRIKSVQLRGVYSHGFVRSLPETGTYVEGDNLAEYYGCSKYIPPVIVRRSGSSNQKKSKRLPSVSHPRFVKFAPPEHLRNYPNVFDGCIVEGTEKIHGSCSRVGFVREKDGEIKWFVGSKNMTYTIPTIVPIHWSYNKWFRWLARPLMKLDRKLSHDPRFWDWKKIAADKWCTPLNNPRVRDLLFAETQRGTNQCQVFGEIYGGSIQKGFAYDASPGTVKFRAFDIMIDGKYVRRETFKRLTEKYLIDTAPILYYGLYNFNKIKEASNGASAIINDGLIREGVVVRRVLTNEDEYSNGESYKMISDEYLARKSKNEEIDGAEEEES